MFIKNEFCTMLHATDSLDMFDLGLGLENESKD